MRLTDNVRLTSGNIVATPSMRKHAWSIDRTDRERWTNDKNGDDKRPSVRRLYISSRKCDTRPSYFQREIVSRNMRDCTSSTRSRKPSWSKCCGFAQSRWNGGWTCAYLFLVAFSWTAKPSNVAWAIGMDQPDKMSVKVKSLQLEDQPCHVLQDCHSHCPHHSWLFSSPSVPGLLTSDWSSATVNWVATVAGLYMLRVSGCI